MTLDYPKASLKKVLELTEAVDKLGGECSRDACATELGRKRGGGFRDLVASANKYNLIKSSKGSLSTSDLFNEYRLAISEKEKQKALIKSFLSIPLFEKVYQHYKRTTLPKRSTFEKELEKTFDVKRDHASRVVGYFEEAAKIVGLMNDDRSFINQDENEEPVNDHEETDNDSGSTGQVLKNKFETSYDNYTVRFTGPDMDATYEINEEEDFAIINAVISKIKKKIK